MVKKKQKSDSIKEKIFTLFYSIISTKQHKEKKRVASENVRASKSKPSLVMLLDAKSARGKKNNPDTLYDAIADAIIKNIITDSRNIDSGVEGIESLLAEAESNFVKKEVDDIHRNRIYIKERLRKENYNGSLLIDDQTKIKKK